ncbi:dolichyl-diphosphooligosaccharide--protein glycosyltransferase 48 kDa subunit [Tanacetum coccineum]
MLDEGNNWGIDPLEFISSVNSLFKYHKRVDGRTKKVLFHSWLNGSWNKRRMDGNILSSGNTTTDSIFKPYLKTRGKNNTERDDQQSQMKRKCNDANLEANNTSNTLNYEQPNKRMCSAERLGETVDYYPNRVVTTRCLRQFRDEVHCYSFPLLLGYLRVSASAVEKLTPVFLPNQTSNSSNASDLIRNVAAECGVDFDEDPSAVVIDHGSYAVSGTEGDHTLIAADDFIQADVLLGSTKIEAPVLFKGIGHSVNPANSLVLKVLSASPSAYSANPKSKLSSPPSLSGSSISLVSVVQARNNARVVFSGSLDLFSNKFFKSPVQKAGSSDKYEKSGNQQFVTELSKWVFHERGHLKSTVSTSIQSLMNFHLECRQAVNVRHHRVGETEEPVIYRINDDLEYFVEIYEWSGSSWEPYVANDVQVQFYMMSPYVLKTMSTDKKGLYLASFKVPDVYGVFQFKVEYQRLGYTSLSLAKQIPVRPFRHNEYERFIPTAFPYYGASFSTVLFRFLENLDKWLDFSSSALYTFTASRNLDVAEALFQHMLF